MRAVAVCAALFLSAACKDSPRDREALARCRDNSACAVDQYCAYSPGLCGRGKSPGACRAKSTLCSDHAPACGCDGKTYVDECDAHAHGVDLDVMGGCKGTIPDFIPCGAHYCDAHTSYCEIYLSDVLEPPPDHRCRALPPACLPDAKRPDSCSCFPADTPCLSFCGPIWTPGIAGFHLTCQGMKERSVSPGSK